MTYIDMSGSGFRNALLSLPASAERLNGMYKHPLYAIIQWNTKVMYYMTWRLDHRNQVRNNRSLLADEDCYHPHPAPNAHGRDEDFPASLLGDVESNRDLTDTSNRNKKPSVCQKIRTATKGMAHSDGPAIEVHFLEWNTNFVDAVDGLRYERLVNLEEVDIVLGGACFLEDAWYGVRKAYSCVSRRNPYNCGSDVFPNYWESQTLGCRTASEENRR